MEKYLASQEAHFTTLLVINFAEALGKKPLFLCAGALAYNSRKIKRRSHGCD
jgi:hypothetical protein